MKRLTSVVMLLVLGLVILATSACGAAKAPAAETKSKVSLVAVPAVAEATRGRTVTFLASGLDPKQEFRLRISTQPELDVTMAGAQPPKINENGAVEIVLDVAAFPVGTYTVKLVGAGEEVLATAPLKIVAPAPAKPAASPKPTAPAPPKPAATTPAKP